MMRIAPKVLALVVVVAAIAYFLLRPPLAPPPSGTAGEVDAGTPGPAVETARGAAARPAVSPAKEPAVSAPAAVAPTTAPPPAAAAHDDLVAMDTLRELLNTEPLRAIELARKANRRAPDSPDAAERSWIIVKALASRKRFHEARDEAAALVGKYPDSSWAMDAKRHMLVQPLDLPSREQQQRQQQP